MEPTSRSLRDKLQEVQVAIYEAAERVAQHRRNASATIEAAIAEQISQSTSVEV